MPLHQLIGQILSHTPVWVWGLLAFVTFLGARQAFDQVVTSRRVIGISLGWMAFSFWGATSTFGFTATVAAAWVIGLGLSLVAQQWLIVPRGIQALGAGRYAVKGSMWPLLTIWAVFGVRYVTSVMMVMNPALKQDLRFDIGVAMLYGMLSALFFGRALRVIRSQPLAPSLATA